MLSGGSISYHVGQFRDLIERTLAEFDPPLAGPVAVALLMGTAAQESGFGHYLRQIKGPAIGAFQMEPATFVWLRQKYGMRYLEIAGREAAEMEWDLRLAIVFCRLRYRADPHPLPATAEPALLAQIWKRVYNTPAGAGTIEQFEANWEKFGLG